MELKEYLGIIDMVKSRTSEEPPRRVLEDLKNCAWGLYTYAERRNVRSVLKMTSQLGSWCHMLESHLSLDDWDMVCGRSLDDVFRQVAPKLSER